jgi:pimeloyl-ACP methyl ester carboxylesterase
MKTFFKITVSCFIIVVCSLKVYAQQDSSKFFASFDGVKIHYEVAGVGEPAVLLHGFTGTVKSWKNTPLYEELLKAGFMVIIPDLRGNGLSDKPHNVEAYEHDAEARDVMEMVSQLNIKQYALVGYSRGSIIASRVLVMDQRVSKVVLGGMGADFMNPEWPRRIMFYKALMGEPTPALEGFMKYIKSSGVDQTAMALLQKTQPCTTKEELAEIKKPVLVICGDKDEDNGPSKALADLIPGATYKRVPGDHNGTSKTKAFADEVLAFLK